MDWTSPQGVEATKDTGFEVEVVTNLLTTVRLGFEVVTNSLTSVRLGFEVMTNSFGSVRLVSCELVTNSLGSVRQIKGLEVTNSLDTGDKKSKDFDGFAVVAN